MWVKDFNPNFLKPLKRDKVKYPDFGLIYFLKKRSYSDTREYNPAGIAKKTVIVCIISFV